MISAASSQQPIPVKLSPLHKLSELFSADMQQVNALIVARMQSPISLIPSVAEHLIAAGGKRIRPLLCLAAASLVRYQGDAQAKLAACVEFIHTATLLHDDVVDESQMRRGSASANALWGNKPSVLVGDFLFSRAFELMVEIGKLPVLRVLSSASSCIAEGEVLQLLIAQDFEAATEHYFTAIESKTAKLFEAACESAAHLAEASIEEREALKEYGKYLGIAFQVADDVLDYQGDADTLGKSIAMDFQEGKITLPVLICWQEASEEEKKFWLRTMQEGQQEAGDFESALEIIHRHDALKRASDRALNAAEQAAAALNVFPVSPVKTLLEDLAYFSAHRCA